ncbi:MAG: hypothetical protein CL472_00805 [Acidobacteria bacterium]|nr:hypothetical protein [Acidobacteriota bacterium]|tara:strand:+ start:245 stop:937 length:693 start_codon:yes stop_codon:yes gene_type:complete
MATRINLYAGARKRDGLTVSQLLRAVRRYVREEIDSELTEEEFLSSYADLKSNLGSPITIYRALAFGNLETWNDDFTSLSVEDQQALLYNRINWSQIGTSWTWDKECAQVGGSLDAVTERQVIIEASVYDPSIDMLMTLWQNLTSFEEEREIRLFPGEDIRITSITFEHDQSISGILPEHANTGPESEIDLRSETLLEIEACLASADRKIPLAQARGELNRRQANSSNEQ